MANPNIPDSGENGWDDGPRPPSHAIIDAVTEETETDPEELPPLYGTIDPEALDRLFANRPKGTVTFSYCGFEVTVERNGEITITSE